MVKLYADGDNSSLSIQDFGLGMNKELMRDIYFNYLDSTKEDTDELIGSWGIGSKSALAYTHTFYIDTIFDGILYHYIFSKQANGIPAGELLFEEPTTDCNGTTVKIPIKRSDTLTFAQAIKNQLIYFPNVFVESNYYNFQNDYTIYEHPNFLYRSDSDKTEMHICLGNVYYPIDWIEIGMKSVPIPVALKFNIGELMPTPSRENIVYGRDSIKVIKDKVILVLSGLIEKYNKDVEDITTLKQYITYKGNYGGRFITIDIVDGVSIQVDKYVFNQQIKEPKLKSLDGLFNQEKLIDFWSLDWKVKPYKIISQSGNKGKNTSRAYYYSINADKGIYENSFLMHDKTLPYMQISGEYDKFKSAYIAESGYGKINQWRTEDIYFIYKAKPSLKHYRNTILIGVPRAKWRDAIKEFQRLSNEYINEKYKSYDDVVVPDKWLDDYKAANKIASSAAEDMKRRKLEQKIIYYYPGTGYGSRDYTWKKDEATIDELKKKYNFIVYAETNDKKLSLALFELFQQALPTKAKFCVITTAKSYHKHFENESHMVEYSEFIKTKHPILCQLATAWKINSIINSIPVEFQTETAKLFAPDYNKKADDFDNYVKKYRSSYPSHESRELMEIIGENIDEAGALDYDKIEEAKVFSSVIKKFNHINAYFRMQWHTPTDYRYYEYLKALFKIEGLEYNKTMNLKPEFNEIYKMCNPVKQEVATEELEEDDSND